MTQLLDTALSTKGNGAFSNTVPGVQLAIDSTSLGTFKECPRKYWYSIILGLVPRAESVHLTFGLLIHAAREDYEKIRLIGRGHEEALQEVVHRALSATWNKELRRGTLGDHKLKNRLTLIRSIVWYLDEFGKGDSMETVVLANGRPAIELSFKFDSGLRSPVSDEPITFCGHLDRIARLNDEPYIVDIKTTGGTISPRFFEEFSPGNQFSMYCLAGRVAFGQRVRGVIVDGMQVAVGFTRSLRGLVLRSEAQLNEWIADAKRWIGVMHQAAEADHWPQNDKACHHYGGCPYRGVCGRSPGARSVVLEQDFTRRVWDPTIARGDV